MTTPAANSPWMNAREAAAYLRVAHRTRTGVGQDRQYSRAPAVRDSSLHVAFPCRRAGGYSDRALCRIGGSFQCDIAEQHPAPWSRSGVARNGSSILVGGWPTPQQDTTPLSYQDGSMERGTVFRLPPQPKPKTATAPTVAALVERKRPAKAVWTEL
jgi:hypothetical protein